MSTAPLRPLTYSRIDQSRLVLTGTLALILTILALWLLIAVLFRAPGLPDFYRWFVLMPPDHTPLPTSPASIDRELALDRSGNGSLDDLQWAIEEQLSQHPGAPIVLYLSAVGVSTPGDSRELRAYLVPRDGLAGDRETMIPAVGLLDLLRDNRWRTTPRLLLLDVGQPGSDRALGVFANGFLWHLKELLEDDPDLLVLTSCAPGQLSWPAEPLGGTIFGHVVVEGLAKLDGQGKVSDLFAHVQPRVARWVHIHRGAIQTPQLWGNPRRDFRLARYRPSPKRLNPTPALGLRTPADDEAADAPSLEESLKQLWSQQGQLARLRRHPAVHAPLAWRSFLDELLQAERHLRAGRPTSSEMALRKAEQLASQVREQAVPHWSTVSWKQALTGKAPAEQSRAAPKTAAEPAPAKTVEEGGGGCDDEGAGEDEGANVAEPKGLNPAVPNEAPRLPEGRIADRYARFIELQGGTDPLHPRFDQERLKALRAAADVAEQGDRAAAEQGDQADALDPTVIAWIGPLIDRGDQLFLEALDKLFGQDPNLFPKARELLDQAESCYAMASESGDQIRKAYDWLQQLRAELPYLGEWMAYRPEGWNAVFRQLLEHSASLADWFNAPPEDWADLPLEELQNRLRAALDGNEQAGVLARQSAAEGAYRVVLNTLNNQIRRVSGPTTRVDSRRWREVDALLRVPILLDPNGSPTISPEARWKLLELARSIDLNPFPDSQELEAAQLTSEMDPIFWKQGIDLAQLELGLLRLSGVDIDRPGQLLLEASQCWEIDPERAFGAIEQFSMIINSLRPRDFGDDFDFEPAATAQPKPEASSAGLRSIAWQRQDLSRADRLARILPSAAFGAFLTTDPTQKLATLNRHAFFTWQGERLARNMELTEANRLLIAAGTQGLNSQDLAEARQRVSAYGNLKALSLNLNQDQDQDQGQANAPRDARRPHRLTVERQGELPQGEAVVLLPSPRDEPLLLIPVEQTDPAFLVATNSIGETTLAFDVESPIQVEQSPAAFFRGRVYSADEAAVIPSLGDSVSLEIRQAHAGYLEGRREIKVPDQFLAHPGEGYLQPNTYLDYKVVLQNNLSRPITLEIDLAITGGKADKAVTEEVTLAPGESNEEAIKASIRSSDFQEGEPIQLVANATEVRTGRPLTKPLNVVFQLLKAEELIAYDIYYTMYLGWPTVLLQVRHLPTKTVFFPVEVTCTVEPASGLLERHKVGRNKAANHNIPPGGFRWYEYRVMNQTIEEMNWSLHVNGQRDALKGSLKLQDAPQPPPNANPGPQGFGPGGSGY